MTFMKNDSMYFVEFFNSRELNILNDGVNEKLEVSDGCGATSWYKYWVPAQLAKNCQSTPLFM